MTLNILTFNATEANIRLDKFLSNQISNLSRVQIQKLIEAGHVSQDNQIITNAATKTKLATYEVNLTNIKEKSNHLTPYNFSLNIIYEDEYLLVINKPAGLTVHPGAGNYDQTLANALIFYNKDNLSKYAGEFRPGIVHRLDKDTSGLIVVAKDDYTHQMLSEALSEREVKRHYLALVFGCPETLAGTIKTYIAKHNHDHTKMVVTRATGKEAITHYSVKETCPSKRFSLLECRLDTGRTHQIRVHLNYKGFPIIGDPVYHESQNKYLVRISSDLKKIVSDFKRQALHAYKLSFTHPITDELLEFITELPEDMKELWQKILHSN